jgi:Icc-related predicted phosphoesterase
MTVRFAAIAVASAGFALGGCAEGKKGDAAHPAKADSARQAALGNPRAIAPLREAAERECAAPIDLTPPVQVQVGERTATHSGYRLTFHEEDADGELVLGVLGPVNEDSGANLVAIQGYRRFFAEQNADAIVVTGDVGEASEGITRVLLALAAANIPVLVVAGHRECRADFTNGVLEAQRRATNVVNMNLVRAVEFPGGTLVSLPGFHDPNYLGCATACRYFKGTVDEVIRVAREAAHPVVLVSHGPPRGVGAQALDYISGGRNVGDAEINRAIKEAKVAFGLFSNVEEAGGRATGSPEGRAAVPEGEASKRLYLNPGPADTVGWEMNDGTQSFGMAAVFRLRGDTATFRVYRAKPLTAAEKAHAQALDPAVTADDHPPAGAVPVSHRPRSR